jgi:hypothetical protein
MSEIEWGLIALILFLGGLVKGSIGFGFPALAVPLLSLIIGPREAVVMLSVSVVVTNIDNVRRGIAEWRSLRLVLPYFIVGIVCVPLGVFFLRSGSPDLVRLVIGLVVIAYLGVQRFLPNMSNLGAPARRGIGAGLGFLAGFLAGMANLPGPVSIIYFSMFRLSKNAFIFVINAFNTLTVSSAIITFAASGEYTPSALTRAALALVPVYVGFWTGVRLRERLSGERFFRLVNAGLFGVACLLFVRGLLKILS